MKKIGYTVNGIKEVCRHTDVNSYCKRHVRHTLTYDEPKIEALPVLDTPTIVEPAVKYKITEAGKFAPNCPECEGKGIKENILCNVCQGKGWDVTHEGYDSLEEYVKNVSTVNIEAIQVVKEPIEEVKHVKGSIGDLVKIKGSISNIRNLHTKYGATVMMQISDPTYDNVVFFTRNKWVNKFKKGDTITVKGYLKEFSEYDGKPQTVLRNPVLSD